MYKILKNLKKMWIQVILIVVLLCIQAVCDLKLPGFTSNIVNVGIQQSGIEYAVPEAIRKSTLENIALLSDNYNSIMENYNLLEKNDENINKYPLLEKEEIYGVRDLTTDEKIELSDKMAKPLMLLSFISSEEYANEIKQNILKSMTTVENMDVSHIDIMSILKLMPEENRKEMLNSIDEKISSMSSSIITQGGISAVKSEYEKIGVDILKISNSYLLKTGLQMLALALLSMFTAIAIMYLSSIVAAGFGKQMRENIFKKVLSFSNEEFNKFSTASLITRSTNDIQQIQFLLAMLFRTLVYAPIMGIGGMVLIYSTTSNFSMAWIIGLAIGIILLVVAILFGSTMSKFKMMQTLTDKLNLVSREILSGIPVIRAFNTQKKEEKRFDEANIKLTKNSVFVNNVMSLMFPIMSFIMQSIMLLIIWVGGHNINDGAMQVGDMMAFLQYTMQIIMSFLFIAALSIMLPRASIAAGRINEILETDEIIKDPSKEKEKQFDDNKKGLVEFKNVSFKYPDGESEVIADISFTAESGKTTAIIGSTGSGKSSIVNLIPRFYDVTSGEIDIDGVNIKDVPQSKLHEKIGFVPQKGLLFTGTIESNIKFGKDVSDEEMIKVSNISQASEFIEDKEEKYQSPIAQGGGNVSGGQKQRLAIARALAINPEILVFDDSFSALDLTTDKKLRAELKKNAKDKTIILVTQRIGTIMDADQIIVIDDGRIVGIGKHKDLLNNCNVYKEIALSQLSEQELQLGKED